MTRLAALLKWMLTVPRAVGWRLATEYLLKERVLRWAGSTLATNATRATYDVHAPGVPHPLRCRAHTSDRAVYRQVFIERQYATIDMPAPPALIVDCGANVGYSAVYFLNRYPRAQLVAIEPDPENFAILRHNLRPYGDRASAVCAAIWPESAGLAIRQGYRDGREWAIQVAECQSGQQPDVVGLDLPTILERSGHSRIDLLKIDIERAEVQLFSRHVERWIDRVGRIAIELHDDECVRVFHQALRGRQMSMHHTGEITIASR